MLPTFTNTETDIDVATQQPVPKRHHGEHKLLELLTDLVQPDPDKQLNLSAKKHADAEVAKYNGEETKADNPSSWWKLTSADFQMLPYVSQQPRCPPSVPLVLQAVLSTLNVHANFFYEYFLRCVISVDTY